MTLSRLVSSMRHWTETYGFAGTVSATSDHQSFKITLSTHTTATRASSIATRLGLIAGEVLTNHRFDVVRERTSPKPKNRAEISRWNISVVIPRKGRAAKRATASVGRRRIAGV